MSEARVLTEDEKAAIQAAWQNETADGEQHEFHRSALPEAGEWKRGLADRAAMESARAEWVPDPESDRIHMNVRLRGERFVCVPKGADSVAFLWKIEKELN